MTSIRENYVEVRYVVVANIGARYRYNAGFVLVLIVLKYNVRFVSSLNRAWSVF